MSQVIQIFKYPCPSITVGWPWGVGGFIMKAIVNVVDVVSLFHPRGSENHLYAFQQCHEVAYDAVFAILTAVIQPAFPFHPHLVHILNNIYTTWSYLLNSFWNSFIRF